MAKLTRRQAGILIATGTALGAQTQPIAPPAAPQDIDTAIGEHRRDASAQLAKVKLPGSTDPAFVFRP